VTLGAVEMERLERVVGQTRWVGMAKAGVERSWGTVSLSVIVARVLIECLVLLGREAEIRRMVARWVKSSPGYGLGRGLS